MKFDFDEIKESIDEKRSYKKELQEMHPDAKLVPCGRGEYLVVREMTEAEKKRFEELMG